ncbi:protein HESO1-like [Lolium perenne]|uniref:protein HESO1-like n=1 Tax=Lolium perenne TaxID=4522 RepID=UPI0021F68636|nr:protein HESO1-like [Lolium perenne]
MVELAQNYHELEKCTEDILSVIKPTEDDRNKRLHAIQELVNSIYLVSSLRDAAVKPFGSFVSNLYAKSGDLDVSVELPNKYGFPTSKEKKQDVLRKLMIALQLEGVARDVNFIPAARVPILQYVSNRFGISCDISIDNYTGRIKSKVLYWISTIDERFGDMVLLVKEWAKAQNINDPKNGTLNSYSLCLLVLFHFQTCKPAILPPLKEIFDVDIPEGRAFNEKSLDKVCVENIAKFRRKDTGQRNQSSLSHLLATFFEKFCQIDTYSSERRISTYTGEIKRSLYWGTRYCCLFVEDPFQRSENAARTVDMLELPRISRAFTRAKNMISDSRADRNELLSLLCTPEVGSKLGVAATAGRYTNPGTSHLQHGLRGFLAANGYRDQYDQRARGSTGSRPTHSSGRAAKPYESQQPNCQQM